VSLARSLIFPLLVAAASVAPAAASPADAAGGTTKARSVSASVVRTKTFRLPAPATHVALHWRGQRQARVRVAFSVDGVAFGPTRPVELDEVGERARDSETYGAVMVATGARAVRVWTSRPLTRLTVLALTDQGYATSSAFLPRALSSLAALAQPAVIPRSGWGADESLRFDSTGKEIWPPSFWPIQKLIVHHTATQNNDPDPTATIRSIYYYHAVTQGWGDIGYNFVTDEAGNVYEGRYSRPYASGESPTGEDVNGNGVTGAHAQGYNSGTVGIALLGTLKNEDATASARDALERLLAWKADRHGIDPQGSSLYTNPVTGTQATFFNIAGHRDVAATECPGSSFYATLPSLRPSVAARIAAAAPDFTIAASPSQVATSQGGSAEYAVSVGSLNGFAGSIDLSVTGVPASATATLAPASVSVPGSSQLTVSTSASTPAGSYPLTITGVSGSSTHTASVTLVVNPPADFALSVSPSSRSVRRGRATSYTVNVSSVGGFADPVALSVAGVPSGAVATFSRTSLVPPGSSVLTVQTSAQTPRGTFTLTIWGASGTVSRAATASLTVK